MANDHGFTIPDFGKQVRIEQMGREVRLVFVAETQQKADKLVENLLSQLTSGHLEITLLGKPTSIMDSDDV